MMLRRQKRGACVVQQLEHLKRMPASFVSEPIVPVEASFDTDGMAMGEPGLPRKFLWRKKQFVVTEILERWKDHGDCRNGSGERYVRRHGYRVRASDGTVFRLYFRRSVGRGKLTAKARWWVHSIEGCTEPTPHAN
jgi:hypothetical protein